MERRHIPETENRLVILYTLQSLGPVTALQLLHAMTEADLMNYITMQLALSDMESQGQVVLRAHPLGALIEVTNGGRFALESFLRRIPLSRREDIDRCAPEWRVRFRREQMTPAEAFTLPDGRVCLHLRLLDDAATLLDLMLYLPGGTPPTLLAERWQRCVQAVYSRTLTRLTEDYDPALPLPPAPPEDTVRPSGHGDWLLTLTDDPHAPGLDLLMSLPDEPLARSAALRWPQVCGELRDFALGALQKALPD